MPKITFLPHTENKFPGKTVSAKIGQSILDVALKNDIPIAHACEKSCACSTCHVIVQKGFASLSFLSDREEDLLDKAWGLTPCSRLSCQAMVGKENLVVEIPKYSRNINFKDK